MKIANIRFNKGKLIPTKKVFINAGFITLSALLVRFIFDSFGIYVVVDALPLAFRYAIIISIAVYMRGLIDIRIGGKDYF